MIVFTLSGANPTAFEIGVSILLGIVSGLVVYGLLRFTTLLSVPGWRRKAFAKFLSLSPRERRLLFLGIASSSAFYGGAMTLVGQWPLGERQPGALLISFSAMAGFWFVTNGVSLVTTGSILGVPVHKKESDAKQSL